MGTNNSLNVFVESLSTSAVKINAFFFILLWIVYNVASYVLSLSFYKGEGIAIAIFIYSFLFYFVLCISGLVNLGSAIQKTKKRQVFFYPKIFIILILLPQVLFAILNPINDATIFGLWGSSNPSLFAFLSLVSIFSFFAYIAGLVIVFRKLSGGEVVSGELQKVKQSLRGRSSYFLAFSIVILVFLFFLTQSLAFLRVSGLPCSLVIIADDRGECYMSAGIVKQDLSICDKMTNLMNYSYHYIYRNGCYAGVAVAKQDQTICAKIQEQPKRDFCYQDVAVAKQDLSVCDKIESTHNNFFYKDRCYMNIALFQKDSSICGRMIDEDVKEECYRRMTGIVQ